MAKFGLFEAGNTNPLAMYEGDFMETYLDQDLVKVMKSPVIRTQTKPRSPSSS